MSGTDWAWYTVLRSDGFTLTGSMGLAQRMEIALPVLLNLVHKDYASTKIIKDLPEI